MPPRASKKTRKITRPSNTTPAKATKESRRPVVLPEDDDAFVRLPTVLGVFPVGETTWWAGIKAGTFPKPLKLTKRVNAWRVADIRRLLTAAADDAA
jgi:predicted DNA-binding transcriptional regulator AlpA